MRQSPCTDLQLTLPFGRWSVNFWPFQDQNRGEVRSISSEEISMVLRQIRLFTAFVLVLVGLGSVLALPRTAFAFVRSEDELMRAEVAEAKARAKDFKKYQERVAQRERDRNRGVEEIKAERRRFEELQERTRKAYVERRGDPDQAERERERREAEDQKRLDREAEKMEARRLEYLKKRARVEATIEREAFIDPAEEYDIHPLPTQPMPPEGETPTDP